MIALFLAAVQLARAGAAADFLPGVEGQTGFGPPVVDASGTEVALTRWDRAGLWAWDQNGAPAPVSLSRGAGFHPVFSGTDLLYKAVTSGVQQALLSRRDGGRWVNSLLDEGPHVGQPAILAGRIAWPGPDALGVRSPASRRAYADLDGIDIIAPDAGGERLAWDDDAGLLHVRDVATGLTRTFPDAGAGAYPAWSSDGALVLHHDGDTVTIVSPADGRFVTVDGRDPAWVPGTHQIVYAALVTGNEVGDENTAGIGPYEVESSTLWSYDVATGTSTVLLDDAAVHARFPAPIGRSGALLFVDSRSGDLYRLDHAVATRVLPSSALDFARDAPPPPPSDARVEVSVPYMHQLWDTPDDFNGNWSCGPTSCLQTLAAFSTLPNSDITCSWPSSHTSHWGWYVPNVYSFGGYTYDTWGLAAGGQCQGAHGFICEQYGGAVWSQMTAFMQQHGVDSQEVGTDYNSVVSETNAGYPMYASVYVLGYGHIFVIRGYISQDGSPIHTVVVNDPYGNAGTGSWGNDDGEDIVYDWPGYNNGNLAFDLSELFTAHGVYPSSGGGDTGTPPADTGTPPVDTAPASDTAPVTDSDTAGTADSGGISRPGTETKVDGIGCQTAPSFLDGSVGTLLLALGLVRRRQR